MTLCLVNGMVMVMIRNEMKEAQKKDETSFVLCCCTECGHGMI